MTIEYYLQRLDDIKKIEFISDTTLSRRLDIAQNTLIRIRRYPSTCAQTTMRKIKIFVDEWEAKNKNLSVMH